jgi:GAF domain-containing protein
MPAVASHSELRLHQHITTAIAMGRDVKVVLDSITRGAARLCGADAAAIAAVAAGCSELQFVSAFGTRSLLLPTALELSLYDLVLRTGRSLRGTDVRRDRRRVVRDAGVRRFARRVLAVPLRGRDGPFGVLAVARHRPWRFTPRDAAALTPWGTVPASRSSTPACVRSCDGRPAGRPPCGDRATGAARHAPRA